jgi:hypothetical protein
MKHREPGARAPGSGQRAGNGGNLGSSETIRPAPRYLPLGGRRQGGSPAGAPSRHGAPPGLDPAGPRLGRAGPGSPLSSDRAPERRAGQRRRAHHADSSAGRWHRARLALARHWSSVADGSGIIRGGGNRRAAPRVPRRVGAAHGPAWVADAGTAVPPGGGSLRMGRGAGGSGGGRGGHAGPHAGGDGPGCARLADPRPSIPPPGPSPAEPRTSTAVSVLGAARGSLGMAGAYRG